jgi:hypothetical protein
VQSSSFSYIFFGQHFLSFVWLALHFVGGQRPAELVVVTMRCMFFGFVASWFCSSLFSLPSNLPLPYSWTNHWRFSCAAQSVHFQALSSGQFFFLLVCFALRFVQFGVQLNLFFWLYTELIHCSSLYFDCPICFIRVDFICRLIFPWLISSCSFAFML